MKFELQTKKRSQCEIFGLTENHDNASILIFHSCSTSDSLNTDFTGSCGEMHTGNAPRSVMTKGISTGKGRYTHIISLDHTIGPCKWTI